MSDFDAYQDAAVRTLNQSLSERDRLLDPACGLAEEAGEVLALVRKHVMQAKPLDPAQLRGELGDALWCLAMTARAAGLSLGEVAEANLEKLRQRWPEGLAT